MRRQRPATAFELARDQMIQIKVVQGADDEREERSCQGDAPEGFLPPGPGHADAAYARGRVGLPPAFR